MRYTVEYYHRAACFKAAGGLSWFLCSVSRGSVFFCSPHSSRQTMGGGANTFPCDQGVGMHQSQGTHYPLNNGRTI